MIMKRLFNYISLLLIISLNTSYSQIPSSSSAIFVCDSTAETNQQWQLGDQIIVTTEAGYVAGHGQFEDVNLNPSIINLAFSFPIWGWDLDYPELPINGDTLLYYLLPNNDTTLYRASEIKFHDLGLGVIDDGIYFYTDGIFRVQYVYWDFVTDTASNLIEQLSLSDHEDYTIPNHLHVENIPNNVTIKTAYITPIPASTSIQIKTKFAVRSYNYIMIYDLNGKLIHHESISKINDNTIQIDISFLSTGLYIVHLPDSGIRLKFIKL